MVLLTMLAMMSHAMSPAVAARAATALECSGEKPGLFIVADMSQPSTERRMWVFSSSEEHPTLLLRTRVAHGSGSDPRNTGVAMRFSDDEGSNATSLGLYRVAERYINDAAQRPAYALDGLDESNSRARARHVVLHPAPYVSNGRVGRSHGCPAVSPSVFATLDRAGVSGALMWIDGPDPTLGQAHSLSCNHQG